MRILAIRGHNLASLAEEFDLDLAGGAIGAAGLFAITGPTGAGKSTLLDALCLALFDRTPRLGARSSVLIGRSDDVAMRLGAHDVRSLLRRGAAAGWAEVDFEGVDDRRYRARWGVRRARGKATGKLQDQTVTLECLDSDEKLGGTRTETLDAIQARLGLSFDQFRRSALLAQGDFAAFLRADTRDRADLLERMTGTEIYGELSMAAHRRAGDVEAGLRGQREAVARIPVMADDARAAAEVSRLSAETARDAARAETAAWDIAVGWGEQRAALAVQIDRARSDVAQVEAQIAGSAERRALLDRIAAAEAVRGRWEQRAAARGEASRAETAHMAALAERASAELARDEAGRIAEAAAAAAARAQAVRGALAMEPPTVRTPDERAPTLAEVNALAARVEDAAAWLAAHPDAARIGAVWDGVARRLAREAEAAASQADARRRDDALVGAQHLAETRLTAATAGHAEAVGRYEEAELLARTAEEKCRGVSVDALRRRHDAAAKAAAQGTRLTAVVERARADAEAAAGADARAGEATARIAAGEAALATATTGLAAITIRLDEAQAGLDRIRAAAGLDHVRAELVDGEPCPVCGSEAHPWAGGGAIDALIAEQSARTAALRQEHRAGTERIAAATAGVDAARREVADARTAARAARDCLDGARDEWRSVLASLGELPLVDDPASAAAADLVAARVGSLEAARVRAASALSEATINEAAARQAQQLALVRRADVDGAALALREATVEVRRITDERTAARAAMAEAGAALTAARDELADLLDPDSDWRARLDRDRAGFTAELAQGAATWRVRAGEIATAARALTGLASSSATLRLAAERRAAAAEAAAATTGDGARRAAEAARTAEVAVAEALAAADLAEADAADLLARGRGFAAALRAELDALERRAAEARAVLAERDRRFAEHEAQRPAVPVAAPDASADLATAAGVAAARVAHAASRAAHTAAERAVAEAAVRLRSDDDARVARERAAADLAAAEAAAEIHRQLSALIGSHDGKAFRAFAQSLSLDALLVVANHHLDELTPRYQLERVPGFDLELQVIDRDLGDEVRSVQSLSGGESFLVSLALALALSSISARNVRVRTLLIDEGFGTLDAATLDVALSVLDALQASGRQVGVISHVPGLAERVGAQIDVRPIGGGRSVVQVRAAG